MKSTSYKASESQHGPQLRVISHSKAVLAHLEQKAKRCNTGLVCMAQRKVAGTALLILAGLAAILGLIAVLDFANLGADTVDAGYAWAAILLAFICGGWGYYFLREPKGASDQPVTPAK